MTAAALLLVHLLSFAAYLGAGFAQLQLMKRSTSAAPPVRDAYESMAAGIVTKIELPAIMGSVASGVGFIVQNGALMKLGWLHAKLTCVLVLLVLSHLEMFNARRIVKARAKGADDEIASRKKRHAAMGAVGSLLVVVILVLVTFVRLGAF